MRESLEKRLLNKRPQKCAICGGEKKPQSKYCNECSKLQKKIYNDLKIIAYSKAFEETKKIRKFNISIDKN